VRDIPNHLLSPEVFPQSLHAYLKNKGLGKILLHFEATTEQILRLITLSGMVKSAEEIEKSAAMRVTADTEGMVTVAAEKFLFGRQKTPVQIEAPYLIDIYPITNEKYRAFIEAGGYSDKIWWSRDGWAWRTRRNITHPAYLDADDWNAPACPVVGVSFHEAEAFAKWAGKLLPTEIQWERAARGSEGYQYPWGDVFESIRCNAKESGIGKTTRVTRYPNGVSPSGCYDMTGNVWEWTSTKEGALRVLKGGSWSESSDTATTHARATKAAGSRYNTIGFRCVSSEPAG
jgi:formylglycine-generating enzyme required for sulfatase activity